MATPAPNAINRVEYAQWLLERHLHWIAFAETKVALTFAVDAALLGYVASNLGPPPFHDLAGAVLTFAGALCSLFSILYVARCVFPQLEPPDFGPKRSLIYFGTAVDYSGPEFSQTLLKDSDSVIEEDLVAQVYRNAQIAKVKFDAVRRAMTFALLSIPFYLPAVFLLGTEAMALLDDLKASVKAIAGDRWGEIPNGRRVPDEESDLTFANTGIQIEACVLYSDLHGSTKLVDAVSATRAAEYYKAFLHCSSRLILHQGGTITAFDGDRVMGIFEGPQKCRDAVIAAWQIKYAVDEIINPAFASVYPTTHVELQHTVGIDVGTLLVVKAGVRDNSDLVWVGPAANYAAKLNSFSGLAIEYPTRITDAVYDQIPASLKTNQGGAATFNGKYNNTGKLHWRSATWLEI